MISLYALNLLKYKAFMAGCLTTGSKVMNMSKRCYKDFTVEGYFYLTSVE